MFKHYLKTTFRNLWNGGFQTVFTIVGLAVAFFCFGICAYFVHGLLTVDNYYENHDRVFAVRSLEGYDSELRLFMNVNFNPEDFIDNFPDVESVFAHRNELIPFVVEDDGTTYGQPEDDQSEFLYVIYCDTTLQHFYNPALLAGSWDAATSSENSMLMSAKYARRLFGSVDAAIGRRLTQGLSGTTYTVRAVIEDLPPNNSIATFQPGSCWIMNSRDIDMYLNLRILLRQGVGVDSFNDKFALPTSYGQAGTYSFKAVPTGNLKYGMGDKYILVLLLILAPGLIVLLSALGNFLHLLISSILKRDREYTLRKVNGARGWDLWLMVGIQVLVTMLLVGITTIVIIMLCTPMLHISLYATLDFEFDTATMLRQSFQHIFILLLLGLLVAWIATVRIRRHTMQAHLRPDTGHHLWRNIMIGGQMTVSFIFVTLLCAMLLQVRKNMSGIYPELTKNDMKEILIIPILGDDPSMGARIEQTLDAIPSVREYVHSSIWDGVLASDYCGIQLPDDSIEFIEHCMCSPEDLQFLGVSLLEGQWFSNADEILADAALVDAYGISVGDEFTINRPGFDDGDKTVTVAGIIDVPNNFGNDNHIVSSRQFTIYSYLPSDFYKTFMVKCLPGTVDEVRKAVIDNIYHEYYPGQVPPEIPTLYDNLQQTNRVERALMRFFWLFAGIALVISLLGIYSAVTMETTVRRKEMAIRKINGAKTRQIAALLGRFYLWLLLISAAIAFPLTYIIFHLLETSSAMAIWRQMFNYGPLFYLCVFLIVAAFVALTVAAQIRRIARIEPYTVVKSE